MAHVVIGLSDLVVECLCWVRVVNNYIYLLYIFVVVFVCSLGVKNYLSFFGLYMCVYIFYI